MNQDRFQCAFKYFITLADKLVREATKNKAKLNFKVNKKYIRVTKQDTVFNGESVWAFVDRANGDILKPATWHRPAKHARENIFNENPIEGFSWTGPFYLQKKFRTK